MIDGYISNAEGILIDLNSNEILETFKTDKYGKYNIYTNPLPTLFEIKFLPGGIDISTGKIVNTTLSNIGIISKEYEVINITPITTITSNIIKKNIEFVDKNNNIDVSNIINESKDKVSTVLSIPLDEIDVDFINNDNIETIKKAIKIDSTINLISQTVNDDNISNDDIMNSLSEIVNTSNKIELSDSSTITDILSNMKKNNNIIIDNIKEENIISITTNVLNLLDNTDKHISNLGTITKLSQINVASINSLQDLDLYNSELDINEIISSIENGSNLVIINEIYQPDKVTSYVNKITIDEKSSAKIKINARKIMII